MLRFRHFSNTNFYLKYVENDNSRDEQFWSHHCNDRGVESWEGFTFEQICLAHLTITADYAEKLRYRQGLFMNENKLKHGTVFTFVTPYGVAKGKYSSMLHSELTLQDLFRPID